MGATSYCRRATTSATAANVVGAPWFTTGSCCARTSRNSNAVDASAATVTNVSVVTAARPISARRDVDVADRAAASAAPPVSMPMPAITGSADILPTPIATIHAPPTTRALDQRSDPLVSVAAPYTTAGPTTSALMCSGTASIVRYTTTNNHR